MKRFIKICMTCGRREALLTMTVNSVAAVFLNNSSFNNSGWSSTFEPCQIILIIARFDVFDITGQLGALWALSTKQCLSAIWIQFKPSCCSCMYKTVRNCLLQMQRHVMLLIPAPWETVLVIDEIHQAAADSTDTGVWIACIAKNVMSPSGPAHCVKAP